MEITFVWSWLSFWIGVASVFVAVFALVLIIGLGSAVKQSAEKRRVYGSLDDLPWSKDK